MTIGHGYLNKPSVAFTVNYGQVAAEGELRAATKICSELAIQQEVICVDCSTLGSGDLANKPPNSIAPVTEWWPYRNQMLVTLAAMKAVEIGVNELLVGAVKTDACHSDGNAVFFEKLNDLMVLQEGGITVHAPAIHLTSAELVRLSKIDISLLAWAHSCHVSDYACGSCRGCFKHQTVMAELGYAAY